MIDYGSLLLYYGNNKEVIHGYYQFFKRHDEHSHLSLENDVVYCSF